LIGTVSVVVEQGCGWEPGVSIGTPGRDDWRWYREYPTRTAASLPAQTTPAGVQFVPQTPQAKRLVTRLVQQCQNGTCMMVPVQVWE
jgi:hypothetical protein